MDFNITGPLRDHLKYITGGFDRAQLVQTLERLKGTNKEPAEETGDTQTKQLALRRQAYHLLQRAALTPGRCTFPNTW